MYKVLIAEDEMFVRLGIKMAVNWESLDMKVIADVENGKQAWDIYEKERPDIILTDLKMPVMDGMELIRRIRKQDSDTRILILSCLEEFQLVRDAISMDVSDYILKLTMTQEDMYKVLRKARKELELIRNRKETESEFSDDKKKRILLDFFYYNTYNPTGLEKRLKRMKLLHFAPPSGHWCVYSGHSALPVARLNRPLFVQS